MHTGDMYMRARACTCINVLIACDFFVISNIATYSQTLYLYIHTYARVCVYMYTYMYILIAFLIELLLSLEVILFINS